MSKSKAKEENKTEAKVLEYLSSTNRPFNINDIQNNLHNEFGKSGIVKAIENLVEANSIIEKTYGKQKIYFINQEKFGELKEEDLKKLENQIGLLYSQSQNLELELKQKESDLKHLTFIQNANEIDTNLKIIGDEIESIKKRLDESKNCKIDPQESRKIKEEHRKIIGEWRKRKRIAKSAIDIILEGGYPEGKESLIESIGIEEDSFVPKF